MLSKGRYHQSHNKYLVALFLVIMTFVLPGLFFVYTSPANSPGINNPIKNFDPSRTMVDVQRNWSFYLGTSVYGDVVLADVVGDSQLEVIVASSNGSVYMLGADGNVVDNWPQSTAGALISSTPSVGDINGDGRLEIVVGASDGRVYAWWPNGTLLPNWPVSTGLYISSSPALADLDGDGESEVIVGSFDQKVYVWFGNGSLYPGWPRSTGLEIRASPAVADLDGDGKPEIVAASSDGKIYVFQDTGELLFGFPKTVGAGGSAISAKPALGDIDGDGDLEIIVGSPDGYVYAFHHTSIDVQGWPVYTMGIVTSSPALCDIDNDGQLEVVVGSHNGFVYAWHGSGVTVPGWPVLTNDSVKASPVIGDVTGDEIPEIVVGSTDNATYLIQNNGTDYPGWPKIMDSPIEGAAAFGDIRRLNSAGLVTLTSQGNVSYWVFSSSDTSSPGDWPMYGHDPSHTGFQDMNLELTFSCSVDQTFPGDTLTFYGQFSFTNSSPISNATINFLAHLPDNSTFENITLFTNSSGLFQHSLELDPSGPEGIYWFEARASKESVGRVWKQTTVLVQGPDEPRIVLRLVTNQSRPRIGQNVNLTYLVYNVGNKNATDVHVNLTVPSSLILKGAENHTFPEIPNKTYSWFNVTVEPVELSVAEMVALYNWRNTSGYAFGPYTDTRQILVLPRLALSFVDLPGRMVYGRGYLVNFTVTNQESVAINLTIQISGFTLFGLYEQANLSISPGQKLDLNQSVTPTATGDQNISLVALFQGAVAETNSSIVTIVRTPNATLQITAIDSRWIYNIPYPINLSISNFEQVSLNFSVQITGYGATSTINNVLVPANSSRQLQYTVKPTTSGMRDIAVSAFYIGSLVSEDHYTVNCSRTPRLLLGFESVPARWVYNIPYTINFSIFNTENVTVNVDIEIIGQGQTASQSGIALPANQSTRLNDTLIGTSIGNRNLSIYITYENSLASSNSTPITIVRVPQVEVVITNVSSEWVYGVGYNVNCSIRNYEDVSLTLDLFVEGISSPTSFLDIDVQGLSSKNTSFVLSTENLGLFNLTFSIYYIGELANQTSTPLLASSPNFTVELVSPPERIYLWQYLNTDVKITNLESVPISLTVGLFITGGDFGSRGNLQTLIMPANSSETISFSYRCYGEPDLRTLSANASYYGVTVVTSQVEAYVDWGFAITNIVPPDFLSQDGTGTVKIYIESNWSTPVQVVILVEGEDISMKEVITVLQPGLNEVDVQITALTLDPYDFGTRPLAVYLQYNDMVASQNRAVTTIQLSQSNLVSGFIFPFGLAGLVIGLIYLHFRSRISFHRILSLIAKEIASIAKDRTALLILIAFPGLIMGALYYAVNPINPTINTPGGG
ncbi:MAG: FG-GAP-like repeat-containing protein, partial [Candidatus Ranarchaeia archaeon]